ncbi:hypothetical protein L226DRAFT_298003 [Lentinus tigrinus ALCF2SS1-7]|uniref:uncharacterized protein n=1 Tax=Lentinus tigrinus ALCF2SS1-7 TaxID=1328758 RepID=UPI001165EE3A|nr:hypothetical protein L226DRAFT_298003 [Lentinus tigrinus ALCF2SS1-7]
MARAQGTRLPASTRARPDGAPGPSGSCSVSGRGVGGAGPSGTQASGSAAPRYPRPDPSSQARRPLSSDSEEEEVRRPKKKKKRILDPDKDVLAMAKTRVKIPDAVPPPTQSRRASHGGETLTAFRNAPRGVRRTSGLNITSPDREGENDATSTPVRPAPPASASTPQLPRPSTLKASLLSKTSADKRRASAPVAPTPREVIEILDSDDEDVPRQPSPKPPPPALPRRKTTQTTKIKKTPAVVFKEVNGVIVLDDSDDDIVEQPPPPAQASTSKRKSPLRVSPPPSDASPDAQASTSQRRDASPPRRHSLSVASFVRSPSPAQQTITQESPVLSPERVVSSPIATEQEDVHMLDDGYVPELPEDTMLDAEMPNDASQDLPSPEQVRQEMEEEQTPPVDEVVAHADEPIQVPPSPAQQFSLAISASSTSPQQVPPTREGTAALETAPSTLRTASPPEAEPPLQVAAPQPSSLAGATKALISRLSSVALEPAQPDSVREGTASPVSSLLDPRLQDLAITGTPTESSASPAQSSSSDGTHGPPISPNTSKAKMRSPKLASASPVRRMRWKNLLYGDNDGFFKAVLRNSEKRRSSSQLTSPLSPISARISPRSSSSTSRMSPKPSLTLGITSASTPALSAPVQESVEPAAMTARSNLVEGGTSSEHISIERTSAAETAMEVEEEQPGALIPTAAVAQEVSRESGHSEGCQQGTDVDSAGEQDPAHPGTSGAIADDTEERSGTAPVELGSSRPLGPTLSEIIPSRPADCYCGHKCTGSTVSCLHHRDSRGPSHRAIAAEREGSCSSAEEFQKSQCAFRDPDCLPVDNFWGVPRPETDSCVVGARSGRCIRWDVQACPTVTLRVACHRWAVSELPSSSCAVV